MPEEELNRDEKKSLKTMKIITAISAGLNRNKDIAKVLDTDKSFASKKIKELEDHGLVYKEGEGKDTIYKVNSPAVMRFLQTRVVITWKKKVPIESTAETSSIPEAVKKKIVEEEDGRKEV